MHGGYDYSRLPPHPAPERDPGFMSDPAAAGGPMVSDYMDLAANPSSSNSVVPPPPPPPAPVVDSYTLTSLDCGSSES